MVHLLTRRLLALMAMTAPLSLHSAEPAPVTRPRILVLCTGNSCRSQMAEGFFRHMVGDRFEVHSAGMKPAESVHPLAIKVMAEVGIDISAQRPKQGREFLDGRPIEYLITVCSSADSECPANLPNVKHRLHWPFDDPAKFTGTEAEILAGFRRVRDEIREQIRSWAAGLPKAGG